MNEYLKIWMGFFDPPIPSKQSYEYKLHRYFSVFLSKSIRFTYPLMHVYIFTYKKEFPHLVNMYSVTSQMY